MNMWKTAHTKYLTSSKVFYIHSDTGECRWKLPADLKAAPLPSRSVVLDSIAVAPVLSKRQPQVGTTELPLPMPGTQQNSDSKLAALARLINQPLTSPRIVESGVKRSADNTTDHAATKKQKPTEDRKLDHLYHSLMRPRVCFVASEILRYLLEKHTRYDVQEPFCKRTLKKAEQQRIQRVLRSARHNPAGYDYDSFCEVADTVVLTERWNEEPRSEVDLYQLVLECLETFEHCPRFVTELPLCHFVITNYVHVVLAVQGI